MNTEITKIDVVRYTTPSGDPTCAGDFPVGKVCIFYSTEKFGSVEGCSYTGHLLKRENDLGYLIPCDGCPVWKDKYPGAR